MKLKIRLLCFISKKNLDFSFNYLSGYIDNNEYDN